MPAALGRLKKVQCDNGDEPWESAYGGIADQCAIKDQRRMSRVSKRSAGYRENGTEQAENAHSSIGGQCAA
jgi:hypothetical protein